MTKLISTGLHAIVFAFILIIGTNTATAAENGHKVIDISAEELHKMLEDKADLVLIDARYDELFKDGHIEGAINIPADKVDSKSLAEVAPNMNKKLVFYCADTNCPASRIAAAKAIGAGYKYVYEFPGGFGDWVGHGYPGIEGE